MSEPEVIVRIEGAVGRLTLNRPKPLHALTHGMCTDMLAALQAWRADGDVRAVLLDHSGARGFCAGGDVRAAAASGAQDGAAARAFFHTEYRLNALLAHYPKPVVAVMDGLVMGGGVGLARPARYRIATERTVFAMPEGAIGLFPDVGAGWWLSRLPGAVGLWLALTGARLQAADCLLLGLATDHIDSGAVDGFKAAFIADPASIDTLLAERETDAGEPPVALVRERIDALFGQPSVTAIFDALRTDASPWAVAQAEAMAAGSPTTLKVAFRQLLLAGAMPSFDDEMVMEYRLASRLCVSHDFIEGVRAVLIDKDGKPEWKPAQVDAVDDDLLEALFAPLPSGEEWAPA